jgi:hypothetical protein
MSEKLSLTKLTEFLNREDFQAGNLPVDKIVSKHADAIFYKKVEDNFGKKYTIEIYVYYNTNPENTSNMLVVVQNEPFSTYSQHGLNTIEKIEKAITNAEIFWETLCDKTYYSDFEGNRNVKANQN